MKPITQLLPQDAYTRLQNGVLLLDVRELDEIRELSCDTPLMVCIPMSQLQNKIQTLPKEKEIITICYSGARSYVATQILNTSGYPNVSNIIGGIVSWKEEGLPIK